MPRDKAVNPLAYIPGAMSHDTGAAPSTIARQQAAEKEYTYRASSHCTARSSRLHRTPKDGARFASWVVNRIGAGGWM